MAGAARPTTGTMPNGQPDWGTKLANDGATPIYATRGDDGSTAWVDANGNRYDAFGNPAGTPERYYGGTDDPANRIDPSQVAAPQQISPFPGGSVPGAGNSGIGGPNLDQAAASGADKYKLVQMHLAALANQAYRPEMAAAGTRALQSSLSAYAPMENVMGSMYGPEGQVDLTKASQNPLTQAMMQIGAPNQKDIGLSTPPQGPPGGPPPTPMPQTPGASMPGLHRGPDGRLYDAQGRLVQ